MVAISARGYRSLALRGDGTVVGWGLNENGQGTPPAGLTGVVAISLGFNHSLALRDDGTVVGWGHNSQGQATPPAGLTDAVAIAAGYNHSLALRSNGIVVGWGFNGDGRATPPSGLTGVAAIAAGERHSLAVVQGHDSLALDVWAGPATKRTLVYSQGPATLTSGDYVIRPATGNVTSVTGTGTIPGLDGSRVTFDVTYNPATQKYAGAVDISGAGFDAHIRVQAGRFGVTRTGDMVKGTLYGIKALSNPKRCFVIVFRIKDLG
ncbi:MAG TPA: hypothetical protein VHM65_04970 [Candidatus Lustribacter sp.]|nr:hypothetical protein [Candidatus Lustribacter sp.]